MKPVVIAAVLLLPALGCNAAPETTVVLDNDYPAPSVVVVYRAAWLNVAFPGPIQPGASSDPQSTLPASDNTAYVVLAPGWDPSSATAPSSLVVLQSRQGFGVHLGDTLHIPVEDATFAGDCAAGDPLTQAQADFITQLVFPGVFATLQYDAATCTSTPVGP